MVGILLRDINSKGGVEVVSRRLLNMFIQRNINCRSYNLSSGNECSGDYFFSLYGKNLSARDVSLITNKLLKDNVTHLIIQLNDPICALASVKLYKSLKNEKIKTYVVIHNSPKCFATKYKFHNESPFVFFLKKMKMMCTQTPKVRHFFNAATRFVTFITLSEGNKQELKTCFRTDSIVIPNYIAFNVADTASIAYKEKNVVFAGRLDFLQKNISLLLDSWNCIDDYKGWHLKIIGSGDSNALQNYIIQKRMKNVEYMGELAPDEMYSVFTTSSILLLTSRYEGLPTVEVEALYSGDAIVSTKYDGDSTELLEDGINGFKTSFSKYEIAEKLKKLFEDDLLLKQFQRNSLVKAASYKAIDVCALWLATMGIDAKYA